MTLSRKLEITAALTSAVAAAFVLTACGTSGPAPAASPSPSHTPAALNLIAACRILRTDIVGNGGTPDRATIQRIIDHATSELLRLDAQTVLPDVGKSDGISMGADLAILHHDCASTGVQIPTSTP